MVYGPFGRCFESNRLDAGAAKQGDHKGRPYRDRQVGAPLVGALFSGRSRRIVAVLAATLPLLFSCI
jgi:hypothetical protein